MIKSLYEPFQKWAEDGAVYIISDTHFGDFDCKLMNPEWPDPWEAVQMINSVVKKKDTLILLGDVGEIEYVKQIKAGHKVLITGNHDVGASKYKRVRQAYIDNKLFDEVYTGPLMIGERILLSHEPIVLPFAANIHGHVHSGGARIEMRYTNEFGCKCINVASDVCGFMPISLGKEIKDGLLGGTPSIHRLAIDKRI